MNSPAQHHGHFPSCCSYPVCCHSPIQSRGSCDCCCCVRVSMLTP